LIKVSGATAFDPVTLQESQRSVDGHWLLAFGFDLNKKEFDVLEHKTNVAAEYKHYKIPFSNYADAYKRGCDYKEILMNKCVFLGKPVKKNNEDFLELYCSKAQERMGYLEKSEASLVRFMYDLSRIANKRTRIPDQCTILLTEAIKYFQREKWLHSMTGIPIHSDILLKKLNLIRTYCIKYATFPSERTYSDLETHSLSAIPIIKEWYLNVLSISNLDQGIRA
jgi:hypothetical protein